ARGLSREPARARRVARCGGLRGGRGGGGRGGAGGGGGRGGGGVEQPAGGGGGGPLPLAELPSFACAVQESVAAALRQGEPPIIGILRDGRLLLDCRTLSDDEVDEVAASIAAVRS